jgi:hypothetical protein
MTYLSSSGATHEISRSLALLSSPHVLSHRSPRPTALPSVTPARKRVGTAPPTGDFEPARGSPVGRCAGTLEDIHQGDATRRGRDPAWPTTGSGCNASCSSSSARQPPFEHEPSHQVPRVRRRSENPTATIDGEDGTKFGRVKIRSVPEGYSGAFLENGGEIAFPELNRMPTTVEITGNRQSSSGSPTTKATSPFRTPSRTPSITSRMR